MKLPALRLSIASRLALVGALVVVLAIGASLALSLRSAEQAMRERAQASLVVNINLLRDLAALKGEPRREGDKLYFGDYLANGNFEIVDKVKALANSTATIFMGDLRVATNVEKPDGSGRAVGTKLAQGRAFDSVFKERKLYSGEADILGVPYFTIYEPIIQKSDNAVIGVLYVGIKQADFLAFIRNMIVENAVAGLVIALLAAGALLWLTSRALAPLKSLRGTMQRLAEGEIDVAMPAGRSSIEMTQMTAAVAQFQVAAQERRRLESEAESQRVAAERERESADGERTLAAREQSAAIAAVGAGMSHLAAGDLVYRMAADLPPAYRQLMQDFNATSARLAETVVRITTDAQAIQAEAGDISRATDELSQRTERQAASLEETAAALDEITAAVRQTAEGAEQARATVVTARGVAGRSEAVVADAVTAMDGIERSAKEISQIIGVIDEIAFQTNLLALNAGVEAARAGEAGRGFAVVATEVRALAQRSADAAKQIKTLISTSSAQVGQGVDLVAQTGRVLKEIVGHVEQIDGLVATISGAAREQASGLAEVNIAVNQMDQTTQQNAAMVEETASASQSLALQADALAGLVAEFKISAQAPAASSARRAA